MLWRGGSPDHRDERQRDRDRDTERSRGLNKKSTFPKSLTGKTRGAAYHKVFINSKAQSLKFQESLPWSESSLVGIVALLKRRV